MAGSLTVRNGGAELLATLDLVRDGIHQLTNREVRESDFRATLLPIALALHSNTEPALGSWVRAAGSLYNGVVVVNDVSGEPLFHTPSIYTELSMEVPNGFHPMIDEAAHQQQHGIPADQVYQQTFNQQSQITLGDSTTHILGWYDIFARYGYRMRMDNTDTLAPTNTPIEQLIPAENNIPNTSDWGDGDLA